MADCAPAAYFHRCWRHIKSASPVVDAAGIPGDSAKVAGQVARRAGSVAVRNGYIARDRESAQWLAALADTGPQRDSALARLHQILLRVARWEVRRRGTRLRITGPELEDLAYQAAADALMTITGKLGQFRGESRFTTWACKFVIYEVSVKVARHFWCHPSVSLPAEDWNRLPDASGLKPAEELECRDLLAALHRAVDQKLTPRQRAVFVAIVLNYVPVDAVAVQLASNRNDIYKTLFDARRKLRAALAANGYLDPATSRPS
jgi:RNA polymerase sigma-70 factor, ECF subfamily